VPPSLLVVGVFLVAGAGWVAGRRLPRRAGRILPFAVFFTPIVAYLLVAVGAGVPLDLWGGLLLTVTVAVAGIVLSFPFGVLLGLGRRSTFPAIRLFCSVYIELVRGVPLITLLVIGSVTIGLLLPAGAPSLPLVVRGLIAIVLFESAYLAETVRGGLQGVPPGQIEAAKAIGLSPLRTTFLIVLPQALRNIIPSLVGQFISLYKDTSLLTGIGLLELLGVTRAVIEQPDFRGQGLQVETFVFAAFLYWIACFTMSRASQRLERRLGVGER
jgi:general L-amino acid transport system permease protein